MLRTTGFGRGVMVQTGLYGTDNRFLLDAIKCDAAVGEERDLLGQAGELQTTTEPRGVLTLASTRPLARRSGSVAAGRILKTAISPATRSGATTTTVIASCGAGRAVRIPPDAPW